MDIQVSDTATNIILLTPILAGVRQSSNQFYYNSSTGQWVTEGEARVVGRLTADNANFARGGTITITPVANATTSGNISWGMTMPAIPYIATAGNSTSAALQNTSFSSPTTTGCTVWVLRTNTTATAVNAVAVSI
jgi:hypothetical protein